MRPPPQTALRHGKRSRMRGAFALLWLVLLVSALPAAAETRDVYARIVVPVAALRTGPGASFRVLRTAQEGDAYPVMGRANRGFWLEIELPDGSHAFVSGDATYTYTLGDDAQNERSRIFAPPPLPSARGELAIGFGALNDSGFMAARPTLLFSPTLGLEANLGAAIGSTGRLLLAGLGGLVNILPHAKIVPFFTAGGGVVWASPNADTFILGQGTRSMVYGGGGLRFAFRHHLILRVEGRGYAFFDANKLDAAREISGGLAAFF